MKKVKEKKIPFELQEGLYIDNHYRNYQMMYANSNQRNWKYNCTYQLLPDRVSGHHQILHLSNMQVSYARREGGIMQDVRVPSGTISLAIVEELSDKICFYRTKLKAGDIIFYDGNRSYNLLTNDTVKLRIVTIRNSVLGSLLPLLKNALHKTIKDTNKILSKTLKEILEEFSGKIKKEKKDFLNAEEKILEVIKELLDEQTPKLHKLTKGEEISLVIREQIYNHIDRKIEIKSLSKEYNISEKTLQNSFKSLFGFTPNKFVRNMKLNHVYYNLRYANEKKETIQKIASKWGFTHMGHFSNFYTQLFGENPSRTLLAGFEDVNTLSDACVKREEELV